MNDSFSIDRSAYVNDMTKEENVKSLFKFVVNVRATYIVNNSYF